MKPPVKAFLMRTIDFYVFVRVTGEDVARGYAFYVPCYENYEVDFYWRNKKAMLRYFHRCRELNSACIYPVLIFWAKLFPKYSWRETDVIVVRHRWFERSKVKTFVV